MKMCAPLDSMMPRKLVPRGPMHLPQCFAGTMKSWRTHPSMPSCLAMCFAFSRDALSRALPSWPTGQLSARREKINSPVDGSVQVTRPVEASTASAAGVAAASACACAAAIISSAVCAGGGAVGGATDSVSAAAGRKSRPPPTRGPSAFFAAAAPTFRWCASTDEISAAAQMACSAVPTSTTRR